MSFYIYKMYHNKKILNLKGSDKLKLTTNSYRFVVLYKSTFKKQTQRRKKKTKGNKSSL